MQEKDLISHLSELRKRLIFCLVFLFISSLICYFFSDFVLLYFKKLFGNIIFTSPSAGFIAKLKISIILGVYISCPFLLWQIFRFIAAGLYRNERKLVLSLAIFSYFFILLGSIFSILFLIPILKNFFLKSSGALVAMLEINSIIDFCLKVTFGCCLAFLLPVFIILGLKIKIFSIQKIKKVRGLVVVLSFIAAAVLTPPDVISQIILAGVLIILFELSLLIGRFIK